MLSKIYCIGQAGDEWLRLRRGESRKRLGASETGAACGISSYCTPRQLYFRIINNEEVVSTPPMKKGHDCEPLIFKSFSEITGLHCLPGGYWEHRNTLLAPYYGCSPDGLVYYAAHPETEGQNITQTMERCDALLELKCPYSKLYDTMPPEHVAQVQYQMWVCGKPEAYYSAALYSNYYAPNYSEDPCPPIKLWHMRADAEYVKDWMFPRLAYLTRCLVSGTPPPENVYISELPHIFDRRDASSSIPAWAKPGSVFPTRAGGLEEITGKYVDMLYG